MAWQRRQQDHIRKYGSCLSIAGIGAVAQAGKHLLSGLKRPGYAAICYEHSMPTLLASPITPITQATSMPTIIKHIISGYWKFVYEQRRRRAEYIERRLGSQHPLSIKYIRKAVMTLPKVHAPFLK